MTVVTSFLSYSELILQSGVIAAVASYGFSKINKKMDKQEAIRIEESVMTMRALKAIGHLSEATAIAQQCGKTNGEMAIARTYYTETNKDLTQYLILRSAERVHM